jgi:hypothetical protein
VTEIAVIRTEMIGKHSVKIDADLLGPSQIEMVDDHGGTTVALGKISEIVVTTDRQGVIDPNLLLLVERREHAGKTDIRSLNTARLVKRRLLQTRNGHLFEADRFVGATRKCASRNPRR